MDGAMAEAACPAGHTPLGNVPFCRGGGRAERRKGEVASEMQREEIGGGRGRGSGVAEIHRDEKGIAEG